MSAIRIGIVEDQPMVLDNLTTFFQQLPIFELVYVANSVEEFLDNARLHLPIEVLLLDIGLPGMSGLEGISLIKKLDEKMDVVMLSSHEDSERIFRALQEGAVGYISKKSSLFQIKEAIEIIHRGGSYMSPSIARKVIGFFAPKAKKSSAMVELTDRQQQIVEGLADGLSYKLIASKHGIALETVRDHIKKIYKKLGVNSKAEVISKRLKGEI
ncbi:MAG: response regulator transcription factor [Bacteroidota bacterium]